VIEHRTIYDEVIIRINIFNTWMGKTTNIMPHNCFSKRSYGFNSNMNPLDTNGGWKNHGGSEITQVLTHLGLVLPIQVSSHSPSWDKSQNTWIHGL
jgi:hypothetical protein